MIPAGARRMHGASAAIAMPGYVTSTYALTCGLTDCHETVVWGPRRLGEDMALSASTVARAAKKVGWRVTRGGGVRCPQHAPETAGTRKEAVSGA